MNQQQICVTVKRFVGDLLALSTSGDINPLLTPENVIIGEEKISLRQTMLPAPQMGPLKTYPGFSAPEVYQNRTGPQTSVYFVGAVLYTLLKGTPPPDAQSRMMQPGTLLTDGSALSDLANRALSVQEFLRPASLSALQEELGKVEAQQAPVAPMGAAPVGAPMQTAPAPAPVQQPVTPSYTAPSAPPAGSPSPMQSAPPPPAAPSYAASSSAPASPAQTAPAAPSYMAPPAPSASSPSPSQAAPSAPATPAYTAPSAAPTSPYNASSTPVRPVSAPPASPAAPSAVAGQSAYGQPPASPYGAQPGVSSPTAPRPAGYPSAPGQPGAMGTTPAGYPGASAPSPYGARPAGTPGYQSGMPGMQPTPGMPGQMPQPQKKKSKKGLWIGLGVAAAVLIAFGAYTLIMSSNAGTYFEAKQYTDVVDTMNMAPWLKSFQSDQYEYSRAKVLYADGEYAEAITVFESLGDYEDSADLAKSVKYEYAVKLMEDGGYNESLQLLQELDKYRDSRELYDNLTLYIEAINMSDEMAAFEVFYSLGNFLDSEARAEAIAGTVFDEAMRLYQDSDFSGAKEVFEKLGSYKNADMYAEACAIYEAGIGAAQSQLYDYMYELEDLAYSIDVGPIVMSNVFFRTFLAGMWVDLSAEAYLMYYPGEGFDMDGVGEFAGSYYFGDGGLWADGASTPDFTIEYVSFDEMRMTNTSTGVTYTMIRYA